MRWQEVSELQLRKNISFLLLTVLTLGFIPAQPLAVNPECTIGVAAGKATADGRPLIWKTRDYISSPDNEVKYNSSYNYKFISVNNAGGSYAWMGVNEKGYAIVNSMSSDLPDSVNDGGPSNGEIMRNCLGNCATVADFEAYLISTNSSGRDSKCNFGVIDSTGAAAIFETSGYQYWKFDANDTNLTKSGYVIRTNFSVTGGGTYSIERFNRSTDLIGDFYSGDSLTHRSLLRHQMRDFSDSQSDPLTIPYAGTWYPTYRYGYIDNYLSICRSTSVSAMVVQGVLPQGEPGYLSTMWTILGQPATSIAVPYWPVGSAPTVADGSSQAVLCDRSREIRAYLYDWSGYDNFIDTYKLLDGSGGGLWSITLPVEDLIMYNTDSLMSEWRTTFPSNSQMLAIETEYANLALSTLEEGLSYLAGLSTTSEPPIIASKIKLSPNYPNPFNAATVFPWQQLITARITINIYNISGQLVATAVDEILPPGSHSITWNSADQPSGVYLYHVTSETSMGENILHKTGKLTLIK